MAENQNWHTPRPTERVISATTVVELRGEIDILTTPPLSARLDTLTAGPHPDLLLDLRRVSFIDCSGLRVLCRASTRVLARHGRHRPPPQRARPPRPGPAPCVGDTHR
ncbi:STAS domain-containing protein, partial [Streptomyces sp. NPDC001652]|uniref:STAS domain-containing protein n=1 Tax=Streptomyces sp. NPDC001652 TaxID=3154393 RepID=UPI00332193DF